MKKWHFHREAAAEFEAAIQWYEASRAGWGSNFRQEIKAAISRNSSHPDSFALIYGDVHCVNVHRFPYGIYYRVLSDSIQILAVAHHRRDPEYWKPRIA